MFKEIFSFEVRYHLRQRVFYFAALLFLVAGILLTSTHAGIVLSDVPGTVDRDAPIVIVRVLTFLSILGLFVITAFVASSVLRDFEQDTYMFFFSRPVRKFDYLAGRFAGSMSVAVLLMLVTALGLVLGRFMPWQDAERVGTFALGPYAYGLVVMALPNLLVMGAVFFAVASWSRRLLVTYICVVIFLVLQDYAEILVLKLDNNLLASMLEPMGVVAVDTATRYWTISEYSGMLPELAGGLLYNRVLWLGIGVLILAWAFARFDYSRAIGRRMSRKQTELTPKTEAATRQEAPAPQTTRHFSPGSRLLQLLHCTRLETASIMRSTPFIILVILGLMLVILTAYVIGEVRGTPTYPVTRFMLQSVVLGMALFVTITIIFYSGELIRREHTLKLDGINDALPVPNWVYLFSKVLTLVAVAATFMALGILSTICVQTIKGFFDFEPGLYARGFLFVTLYFILFSVLAVFLQVVSKSRFSGYLLAIVIFLMTTYGLHQLGLEHELYRYGGAVDVRYSDMNGHGHLLVPFLWVKLYWGFVAGALIVLSVLFWRRGTETAARIRLAVAGRRLHGRLRLLLAVTVLGFIATGSFIFYNTNVLNEYFPGRRVDAMRADYEKKYRRYRDIHQPRITDVYADVNIFPHERRVEVEGRYRLENKTATVIDTLHVSISPDVTIEYLDPGRHDVVAADEDLGYYRYELSDPVDPGDSIELRFMLTVENRGFVNNNPNTHVIANGTFFNNGHYFPSLGYDESAELIDRNKRRRHGLAPVPRMAAVDDSFARRNTYIANDADWINFETIVSTSSDQTAIAPGYLEQEWRKGDRRYFHYKMDIPMLNFYSYLSADYAIRHDQWEDVAIEIYYHEPHDYNIDRMIDAVKKSLEYFSTNFGPYQHRLVRIIEFPCYETFAQSFPTTIPFSEGAGFVFRLDDRDDINHVFNTTAHEVAHQWWAHQVIGGNVQGATLMSEALSEYSALMVMEKEYGPDKMRHMLKYELDGYLRGRGREVVEERPLALVENQMYIHYNKGCLVMYALKDYIGEENINRALAAYVADVAYQAPPYTNSRDFLGYLREVTPDSLAYIIEDMFETITLFSNRVKSASYTPLGDGRYLVDLEVEARKLRADGRGVETEVEIDDWIDIGVFGEKKTGRKREQTVLLMEKRHMTTSSMKLELVVDAPPVRAGIDPYNRLIDRDSDDNVKTVSERGDTDVEDRKSIQDL
jgi:ABC-type transport system involved in multi-copper enzyme maturation permease subunit